MAWACHLRQGASGLEIDPALLADLEPILHRALENGLYVLLDWHHFNDLTDDPAAHRARFVAGWQVIAKHFQSWPPELFLELLKENPGVRSFIEGYNTLPADKNPCSANAVMELLDLARAWSTHFGRPIHLGEFGSHDTGDQASRSRYTHDVRTLAEARQIPWTLWDWKATFCYWDSQKNLPLLRTGLFEK